MDKVEVHPHALVHGLSVEEILQAWFSVYIWTFRVEESEREIFVGIGKGFHDRDIELIAAMSDGNYLIFHAMTPPTRKIKLEVGLLRGREGRR